MIKEVSRAIIINDEGKVLLGRRGNEGLGKNQWALVGGKPNPEETLKDSVIREMNEELGINFKPTLFKEILDHKSDPPNVWRAQFFVGKLQGQLHPKPDEIVDIIFVAENDLDKLDIAFNHREILREFFQKYQAPS